MMMTETRRWTVSFHFLLAIILQLVMTSLANALPSCRLDYFYDVNTRSCTPCSEICDPRRGTHHLCTAQPECSESRTRSSTSRPRPELTMTTATTRSTDEIQPGQVPLWGYIDISTAVLTAVGFFTMVLLVILIVLFYERRRDWLRERCCCCCCCKRYGGLKHNGTIAPASVVSGSKEALCTNRIYIPHEARQLMPPAFSIPTSFIGTVDTEPALVQETGTLAANNGVL